MLTQQNFECFIWLKVCKGGKAAKWFQTTIVWMLAERKLNSLFRLEALKASLLVLVFWDECWFIPRVKCWHTTGNKILHSDEKSQRGSSWSVMHSYSQRLQPSCGWQQKVFMHLRDLKFNFETNIQTTMWCWKIINPYLGLQLVTINLHSVWSVVLMEGMWENPSWCLK